MSFQNRLFAVLGAALVVAACNEGINPPAAPVVPAQPGTYSLTLSSPTLSIVQGGNAAVIVTVARTNFRGYVTLVVDVATFGGTTPSGVTTSWAPNPVSGDSAVLTFTVDSTAVPGVYDFIVFGREKQAPGVSGFSPFTLTILPDLSIHAFQQWATTATASSQYEDVSWAAQQATGAPNVVGCQDNVHAWASLAPDTSEWLELTYGEPVQPTLIRIYENWTPGSIVKVEVKNASGQYTMVYTAQVTSPDCPRRLEIVVTGVLEKISVVRITVDQSVHHDWTEIDAVQLVGFR